MQQRRIKHSWFITLALVASPSMACQWSAEQLVGDYNATEQAGFFETFALDADGGFQSWLHERPDANGEWLLDDQCVLQISVTGLDNPIVLTVQSLSDTSIELSEDGQVTRYQRLSN